MSSRIMPRRTRLVSAAVAALALSAALSACSDAELEVSDVTVGAPQGGGGEASESPADAGSATAVPGTAVAADDPDVEATTATVGAFQLRLPAGWSVMDGMDGAASGTTGAATYTAVPAAGKDQTAWIADLLAGTTDVVAEREGLAEQPVVVLADGTQAFHLVHNYSENRAHIFGTVKDDTLHLLRFGLDGTPEAAAAAAKAVSTAVIVVPNLMAPVPSTSASPAPSSAPSPAPVEPVDPTLTPATPAPA